MRKSRGFTLIETVLAIGMFGVVILTVTTMFIQAMLSRIHAILDAILLLRLRLFLRQK